MKHYSRRELYALGEPLGESVTQAKVGGGRVYGGGGSGGGSPGPTQSTTVTSNVPEYARPFVERMLGAAEATAFKRGPGTPAIQKQIGTDESGQPIYETTPGTAGEITGFKPYVPYGATVDAQGNITNTAQEQANAAVAGFSPMQEEAFKQVAALKIPEQYGQGSQFVTSGGIGSLDLSGRAAGVGQDYYRMATDPGAQAAFMSPYMQNVVDRQKLEANRDFTKQLSAQRAQSAGAGAFGGSRSAIAQSEAQRNLNQQLQNIQATGTQRAFEQGQQAQQFGANLGLQGLQTGLQGFGQTIGAGKTLADIGGAQFGAQKDIIGLQSQAGSQQQQLEQARINQSIQNYALAQQYPQMQLSMMSSLLRGLPLQQATTQQYQAAPSAISQIGGLGTAGIGAYGLGRAAGIFRAGGKVKSSDGLAELGLYNVMSKAG
jgi:hypothetical protein